MTHERTDEFHDAHVREFIAAECETNPHFEVRQRDLRWRYEAWCPRVDHPPISETAFGRILQKLGFNRRLSHTVVRLGLRLR